MEHGSLQALARGLRDVRLFELHQLDGDEMRVAALESLLSECHLLLAAASIVSSALLSLPEELLMRLLSHCSALTLLQLGCTCTTLRTRTGRAIPDVVRRLFGEGTMLNRFASEMLQKEPRLHLLGALELASELSHIWVTRGADHQPIIIGVHEEASYNGLAQSMVLREGRSLKAILTKAFGCPDDRVPNIFLGRDRKKLPRCCDRASFVVAALLAVLDSGALANGKLIVRLIKGLGVSEHGGTASPALSTWANGDALQPIVVGLFTLFDHHVVGPAALKVFQLDDPNDINRVNPWYDRFTYAPKGFFFRQLVGALHALHDGCLQHALGLLHDGPLPDGRDVPDGAECAAALLRVLESQRHQKDAQVMQSALNLFHEGGNFIDLSTISDTELPRWIDVVVKVLTLHPEPHLSTDNDYDQEDSILWNGLCVLRDLTRHALWSRLPERLQPERVRGTALKEVERRLPHAVKVIVQLALPRLLYSAEQFGNDTSMMHFGLDALSLMAISPVVARDCRGLPSAIAQVLQESNSILLGPGVDDEDDGSRADRANELLAEGLTALGFLALHDGKAVVEAGAIPIAVKVLQAVGEQAPRLRAWEAAMRLLGFLSRDSVSVEAAARRSFFPPFVPYLRAMPAAIDWDGRAPAPQGGRRNATRTKRSR